MISFKKYRLIFLYSPLSVRPRNKIIVNKTKLINKTHFPFWNQSTLILFTGVGNEIRRNRLYTAQFNWPTPLTRMGAGRALIDLCQSFYVHQVYCCEPKLLNSNQIDGSVFVHSIRYLHSASLCFSDISPFSFLCNNWDGNTSTKVDYHLTLLYFYWDDRPGEDQLAVPDIAGLSWVVV